MVPIEVATYAAGLIDGEGYIGVSVAKPGGPRITPSYRIRVKIAMCERGAIDYMMEQFGGTHIYNQRRSNPKHRPLLEWTVTGGRAALLLASVEPHLKVKRKQAQLALELFRRVKATKTTPKRGQRGIQRTALDEIVVRTALWQEIKRLNTRGL